jgi:hypothetical protein
MVINCYIDIADKVVRREIVVERERVVEVARIFLEAVKRRKRVVEKIV